MKIKDQFKKYYGVDVNEVVERFEAKVKATKQKFDYDVSALDDRTDNTLPDLISALIANSEFLSELTLEEGVKGTREIALLNADITLQAKTGCAQSPDGSVVFTGVDLTTKLLYAGVKFCNEDLNGKMTQILNVLGVKRQNGQLPAEIEDILMAYLMKVLTRKAQRVVLLGDTTSLDSELALFDGLVKIIDASSDVAVYTSPYPTITPTNGYDIAFGLFKSIDGELFDNGVTVNIYTGRTEALEILEQWNNDNPYSQVEIPTEGTSMTFRLPLTNVMVKTLPELNGKNKMYAIPTSLTFLGTDLMSDMELDIKYDDYNDELKAEASFRLGTNIVWDKYFTRLELTAS